MPKATDSDSIISAMLGMVRSEREAYLSSVLDDPKKPPVFLEAADALSDYLSLLRTGGGVLAHQQLRVDETVGNAELERVEIEQFEIGEKLGSGGFADVYAARQLEPIQRDVAIKILRHDPGNETLAARFQSEQQALAQLDHPSIAQVFDAGRTNDGRLFFVMEKIDGVSITQYCHDRALGLNERLGLFREVCDAVEFAHSRGIVHRDLKPSNVMVTDAAGRVQAKVIDFGIAKGIEHAVRAEEPLTGQGEFLGTLSSMSPEQIGARSIPIDRRTDVYALGVLLYELLCDAGPFSGSTTQGVLMSVWRYVSGETQLTRPSRLAEEQSALSPRIVTRIEEDLDWITCKAMAIDPAERYQSVMVLSEDILRFLSHQPVAAGPPSARYRARKFVRRNWPALLAAGSVLAALTGGLLQTTIERNRTAEALETLTLVTDFQSEMLSNLDPYAFGLQLREVIQSADPGQPVNYTDAARSAIDKNILSKAGGALGSVFADKPEVEGQLRQSLADVYMNLGMNSKAVAELEKVQMQQSGASGVDQVQFLGRLANALDGDGRYEQARALGVQRLKLAAADFDPLDPIYLGALSDMASIHISFGDFEKAEKQQLEAMRGFSQLYGENSRRALAETHLYATILHHQGRLAESLTYREAVLHSRSELLDRLDNDLIVSHVGLGSLHHHLGNLQQATYHLKEAFSRRRESLGENHPRTLSLYNRLAAVLLDEGKLAEAEAFVLDGVGRFESTSEPDTPRLLLLQARLAAVRTAQGRHEEAVAVLQDVHRKSSVFQGEDNPETVVFLHSLASAQLSAGRPETARSLFSQAIEHYLRIWGDQHPRYGILLADQAELEADAKRFSLALDQLNHAEQIFALNFGEKDHRLIADVLLQRARFLALDGRSPAAQQAGNRAADMYQRLGLLAKADEALALSIRQ
ncbi:MAG: serine/threonine-protein kinase [Pseudomonadota bacterium]